MSEEISTTIGGEFSNLILLHIFSSSSKPLKQLLFKNLHKILPQIGNHVVALFSKPSNGSSS